MRENKFRGRRIDNGEWVYGHYFTPPPTDENSGLPPESGWFFLSGSSERHCIEQDGVVFTVDPETVGQFTGLLDSKRTEEYPAGQPIYEGDVVQLYGHFDEGILPYHNAKVLFKDGCFCIDDLFENDVISISRWDDENIDGEIVVIGNIYENPELLGGDSE